MDFQIIYAKNAMHLGDCIYSLIFLYNIHDYLKKNNIKIYFYCINENYYQIADFNTLDNVKIFTINNLPNNEIIFDLWIGSSDYDYNWYNAIVEPTIAYDKFFCKYYNNILTKMNIPVKIEKFIYKDNDLITRCRTINLLTNNYYDKIDFLINNAQPCSDQFEYDLNEFNNFITKLSNKFIVVTTQKVNNIKCTRDFNLTAKDIAAISINIKNFIAIESGVFAGLYNEYLVDKSDRIIFNLSKYNYHFCSFKNFYYKKNLGELKFLI